MQWKTFLNFFHQECYESKDYKVYPASRVDSPTAWKAYNKNGKSLDESYPTVEAAKSACESDALLVGWKEVYGGYESTDNLYLIEQGYTNWHAFKRRPEGGLTYLSADGYTSLQAAKDACSKDKNKDQPNLITVNVKPEASEFAKDIYLHYDFYEWNKLKGKLAEIVDATPDIITFKIIDDI